MPEPDFCVCLLPLRQLVDCRGLRCRDCGKPITDDTYRALFWPVDGPAPDYGPG